MTKHEWLQENDVSLMTMAVRASWSGDEGSFRRRLHRFYLACARKIWNLLPQRESREGIEIAEQYLDGTVSRKEFEAAEYNSEGAAFNIDYDCQPELIEGWVQDLCDTRGAVEHRLIVGAESRTLARDLLKDAAYFAHFAMIAEDFETDVMIRYPAQRYPRFLSAPLLREIFGNLLGG